jgi:hypothetical protein
LKKNCNVDRFLELLFDDNWSVDGSDVTGSFDEVIDKYLTREF